ncbi:MAG: hypothetical protein KGO02_07395, partial [Alphaproteobacteria bacterium]|nr:hypothetical protein [Alphaproteobacteria bacterium]
MSGFEHPSSVACDVWEQQFFVAQYGPEADPTATNDKGSIIRVNYKGRILERGALKQGEPFHRPSGILIAKSDVWLGDLDEVVHLNTERTEAERKQLPGVKYADHLTIDLAYGLYVTDSRTGVLDFVPNAEFWERWPGVKPAPDATIYENGPIHPSGVFRPQNGGLFILGAGSAEKADGIYFMRPNMDPKYDPSHKMPPELISEKIGQLTSGARINDNEALLTDKTTHTLLLWTKGHGVQTLASDF